MSMTELEGDVFAFLTRSIVELEENAHHGLELQFAEWCELWRIQAQQLLDRHTLEKWAETELLNQRTEVALRQTLADLVEEGTRQGVDTNMAWKRGKALLTVLRDRGK